MGIRIIKQIIVYFVAFILIFGLTSTFTSKEFIGRPKEIGLKGDDLIRMQVALNQAEKTNDLKSASQDGQNKEDLNLDFPEQPIETYQKGDTHNRIKDFQEILVSLGFLKGTPDGMFGSMTENAVTKYQSEEGLEETGALDPETQIALEKSKEDASDQQEDGSEQQEDQESQADNGNHSQGNQRSTGSIEHTVSANETISQISDKYNVPVSRILQANQLNESSVINIGQKLLIPQD